MRTVVTTIAALIVSLMGASQALGQSTATGGPTPSPPGARVYFIDLKDGAIIGPTTTIHFGLHGMGVAPAGSNKANTGHHHLLIDVELPPLDQPIPSDENHLHFGAGQTEVELTLPPGPHTLQLLLGDANHIPHSPPVMSVPIHVTVAEAPPAPAAPAAQPVAQTSGPHPSPAGAKVYIISPPDGAHVPLTFTVKFGLIGMGVAPAGVDKPNSGHHHLLIDTALPPLDQPIPSDENHLHFGAGQTETTITLTPGRHTLQLLLGDLNHVPHQPPVYSTPITVYAGMEPQHMAPSASRPARITSRPVYRPGPANPAKAGPACGAGYVRAPDGGCQIVRDLNSDCQSGLHPVPAPTSSGYRCVPNGY